MKDRVRIVLILSKLLEDALASKLSLSKEDKQVFKHIKPYSFLTVRMGLALETVVKGKMRPDMSSTQHCSQYRGALCTLPSSCLT